MGLLRLHARAFMSVVRGSQQGLRSVVARVAVDLGSWTELRRAIERLREFSLSLLSTG